MPAGHRLFLAALALVASLAFAGRELYRAGPVADDPLQGAPLLDTAAYEAAAHGTEGDGISYRPPGYPWLLRTIEGAGGDHDTVLRVQSGLDALTTLLVAAITWRLCRRRAPTVLAAVLFAVSPTAIYFSAERLETSWMMFLVAVHALALLLALADEERAPRTRLAAWAAVGVTLGVAALVRPNALLWLPVLAVAVWRGRGRLPALATLLGCVLAIAPVTVRNAVDGGELVLIAPNGGVNLYLGNVPDPALHDAVPYYDLLPGPVAGWGWERLGRRAYEAGAEQPGAASTWHARRALDEMSRHPLRTARLLLLKTAVLVDAFPVPNNRDLRRPGSALGWWVAPLLGWGLLLPLVLVAAVWRDDERTPHVRWLLGLTAVLGVSVVLFFVCERHRAPLLPLVVPLAAVGLVRAADLGRPGRGDTAVRVTLAVAALALNVDVLDQRERYADYVIDPVGVGDLLSASDPLRAKEAYELALARDEDDPLALCNFGSLAISAGVLDEAEAALRRSVEIDDRRHQAWNNLALVLHLTERNPEALVAIQRARELAPGSGMVWVNGGRILHALGRSDEARASLVHALGLLRDPVHGEPPIARNVRGLIADIDEGR
jgi:tetratricopeptide (TPR) repeat protein